MNPDEYASFLVRLWRQPLSIGQSGGWQGEIEHIQSGVRWSFSQLTELLAYLQQAVVTPNAPAELASNQILQQGEGQCT